MLLEAKSFYFPTYNEYGVKNFTWKDRKRKREKKIR